MLVVRGYFSEIKIFIWQYVLDHSESIPIQNISNDILVFAVFSLVRSELWTPDDGGDKMRSHYQRQPCKIIVLGRGPTKFKI